MGIGYLGRRKFLTGCIVALVQTPLLSQVNSGQAAAPPSTLEAIAQTAAIPHKPEEHAEFFGNIVAKVQKLNDNKVPYDSDQYRELFDTIISDYGIKTITSHDIINSGNFSVEVLQDAIYIAFRGVPGPNESKTVAFWISQDHALPVIQGKDGSLIIPGIQDLYRPHH